MMILRHPPRQTSRDPRKPTERLPEWIDGNEQLIQADARVVLVGVADAEPTTYFRNYSTLPWEWRFSLARVDGEPLAVLWRKAGAHWLPHAAIRVWWRDGKVVRIRDYVHVEYLLKHARTEAERPT